MSDTDNTTQPAPTVQTPSVPQPVAKPVQAPVSAAASQPEQPDKKEEVPVETATLGNKEQAPMPISSAADHEGSDQPKVDDEEDVVIQQAASAGEVPVSQELKEVGVEAKVANEAPKISAELKAAGVAPAKEATPVASDPTPPPKYPMTEEEAIAIKKKNRFKIRDSITWFATQVGYLWKKEALEKSEKEKI